MFFTDFNWSLQSTTYNRTPFAKCLLIFLRQNAMKIQFLEKLIRKKKQKNFIVNNNKIIRAWYLSSKWLVCRSIVNQTTGGTSILSHIVSCFAIKWLKYTCNKGILSIQIMGKCIFVPFRNFSILTGEQN